MRFLVVQRQRVKGCRQEYFCLKQDNKPTVGGGKIMTVLTSLP